LLDETGRQISTDTVVEAADAVQCRLGDHHQWAVPGLVEGDTAGSV
jgi:hypothetical protein